MASRPKPITDSEIAQAFSIVGVKQPPVILSPKQLADLLGLSVKTIYDWLAKDRLLNSSRRRGKHVFIFRDRAIKELFCGPDWTT
jgi:predicted DNA-binding transcriptional regulator AlpA